MNDQHAHAGYAAHDGYQNGSFATDPLFGNLPDGSAGSEGHTGHSNHSGYEGSGYDTSAVAPAPYDTAPYDTGQYDSTQWGTGSHTTVGYDTYGTAQYDTSGQWSTASADTSGQWDATAWNTANTAPEPNQPNGPGAAGQFENTAFDSGQFDSSQFDSGQFDGGQFDGGQFQNASFGYGDQTQGLDTALPLETPPFETAPFAYEATAQWTAPAFDTGAYEAAWNAPAAAPVSHQDTVLVAAVVPEQYGADTSYEPDPATQYSPGADFDAPGPEPERAYDTEADAADPASAAENPHEPESLHMAATMTVPAVSVTPRPVGRAGGSGSGGRGRRRTPAKRSALLTIAVPSACVMGVAGVAAASVGSLNGGEDAKDGKATTASAADTATQKPEAAAAANKKLDTQLATLSAGARDFGDRASRTQERIDLQARQEADRKKRVEEAARKEAERPKFVLPVSQHGLSAYYGQAGVNWMSVHTGIDFPVSYGTPVMAATDGTVRTQYNSAYGNMAIVTSPDGTETWYCHLSSTKIRSGSVKAGDVIAYSGSSGNSTGPHLHFEVRPGAGSAIDPLPWLRSHGVDPT
ncbi:M23 family metallopeptidase [Streptomyces corynorhini]|uniref:M23 family peptidase n=1 Tax=Streptomyces corynorhini TaxID=2282652 RepID=A0A370BAR7_9ACTN|nr:M23 family metallopeptidase [Streptomyces corynorhini]RDG37732.1 M23 family peptidase [Streptomyces corynorhini]